MGITTRKSPISYRPTEQSELHLAELMGHWQCKRNAAISTALRLAHVSINKRPPPPPVLDAERAEREKFLAGDRWPPEEQAKMSERKAAPLDVNRILTADERQAKADDFYRSNMAKGKK